MAEFTEHGKYIPDYRLAGDLRNFLECEYPNDYADLIEALHHVPHYAIVYLHENGISVEVRSKAGLHCTCDVSVDQYEHLKLMGLVEAKTSIDNVPLAEG